MHEERVCKSESEKTSLNSTLNRLEEDNMELQRQVQNLQSQMAELESQHAQRYVKSHCSVGPCYSIL